jgi:exopolysaccharide biosynthesis polyprenyl glycosylphosphotransferase
MSLAAASARDMNLRIYAHILPLLSITAVVCFSLCGLYRSWSRHPVAGLLSSLFMAECLYLTAWMSISGWEPRWTISRGVILASAALQFLSLAMERILFRKLVRDSDKLEHGLIVANDLMRANIVRQTLSSASPAWLSSSECLTAAQFRQLSDEEITWGTVLVAPEIEDKASIIRRASQLRKSVFVIPGIFELWMVGAHPVEVDDVLMLRLTPPHLRPAQRSIKRLLDVAGALCLLVLTAPVTVAIAILVRLSSSGPAWFSQTRVGADGKEFTLYKFRTMIVDAEHRTGPVLATSNDPRVTAVGHFLRATRMDELPQLINVLIGNMSLIGPRPERPYFVRIFRKQLPGYEFRLAVKPGMTGLAQIYGRYSTTPERKLRFDLMYIHNYSLTMDIRILFKTVSTILQPSQAEGFKGDAAPAALSGSN